MKAALLLLTIPLFAFTCDSPNVRNPGEDVEVLGMKPLYVDFSTEEIMSQEPRDFDNLGSLVLYRDYLLLIEQWKGVHVIDNEDPSNPSQVAFWNIPGIISMSIEDDALYVPIVQDLIIIDIANVEEIEVLSVTQDLFELESAEFFPENYTGSFECVDQEKGILVGWEEELLFDPKCWR